VRRNDDFVLLDVQLLGYVFNVFELLADVFLSSHLGRVDELEFLVEGGFEIIDVVLDQLTHVDFLLLGVDFEGFVEELVGQQHGPLELGDVVVHGELEGNAFEGGLQFVLRGLLVLLEFEHGLNGFVIPGHDVHDLVFRACLLETLEVVHLLVLGFPPDPGTNVDHGSLLSFLEFLFEPILRLGSYVVIHQHVLFNSTDAFLVVVHALLGLLQDQETLGFMHQVLDFAVESDFLDFFVGFFNQLLVEDDVDQEFFAFQFPDVRVAVVFFQEDAEFVFDFNNAVDQVFVLFTEAGLILLNVVFLEQTVENLHGLIAGVHRRGFGLAFEFELLFRVNCFLSHRPLLLGTE